MSEGEQSHQDPEQGTSSLKLGRVAVIRILVAVCIIAPAVIWIEHKLAKPRQIPYWNCLSNIKRTIAAINLYQADWDDRIPNGDWIPKIVAASKYKGNDHVFGCPSVVNENPAAYGYALSRWVAGKDVDNVSTPELTALLFDSSILSRSAISDFSTVPSPPRHNEMNYFGFVDGHAKAVKPSLQSHIIQGPVSK